MENNTRVRIRGLVETRNKLNQVVADIKGNDFREGMQEAVLIVLRDAREFAPVDTGRLRNSITGEVRFNQINNTVEGVVGSNLVYAPYMELGTRPHFPPLSALQTWARRHGTNAFVVARAISRRGLKGRFFLRDSFNKNKSQIKRIINNKVSRIVSK